MVGCLIPNAVFDLDALYVVQKKKHCTKTSSFLNVQVCIKYSARNTVIFYTAGI